MKLSKKAEHFILMSAPKHIASEDSPNTYESVRKFWMDEGLFHVFSGGTPVENTIFSSREVQYAYRAWHDSIHMKYEIPFGMQSELAVARLQESIALDAGVAADDAKLLRLDLEAHIEYYYASGLNHPDKQLDLIEYCLTNGIQVMVEDVQNNKVKFHD